MSPAYGLGVSFEAGRKAAFRARYHFNGTLDLGRFGTAEEAQRAYDQAILSINAQHYRATNFPPGTLTAFNEVVDDRIRRHLSALGLESAYRAPATWLNQPAAGGHADPAAAAAAAPPAPAAASAPAQAVLPPAAPAPPAAAPAAVGAAAGDGLPLAAMQDGGLGQHSGSMHGSQDADMMMMPAAEMSVGSSAADMQPLPELDALLQADMDADSTNFAALFDEVFTDCAPVPAAANAAFGTASMQQQQASVLLGAGTACPPAATAGWSSSSGAAVQQHFKALLGGNVGCPSAAAAGPSNSAATSLQYVTMQRLQKQQWQHLAPGSPLMGSPAAQGPASVQQQQQQPGVDPVASSSGFFAPAAAASQYSTSAGDLAPAAAAGAAAGFGVCAHAYARAPAATRAAVNGNLQQPSSLAALASVGELVLFVDTSILHLTQLYSMCMLLAASGHQYAGMVAIDWVTRLRSRLHSGGAVGALVASMVMRLCSNLTAIASAHPAGAFDSAFLVLVLEQLFLALLELRALCTGPQAAQGLGSILHTWRLQLQAGAGTRLGLAVLEAVSELCGMWN